MKENKKISTKEIVFCGLFSALITVGAYLHIPIPLVPMTLQPMFTLLAGLLLGSRLGALSVSVYVIAGLIGVPVFTGGGGPSYILRPTFGYLLGFIIGAYIAGKIAEKKTTPTYKNLLIASFLNMTAVYSIGIIWLYFITNFYLKTSMSIKSVLLYGFAITAPSDVIISFVCAGIAHRLIPVMRGFRHD
ncbi:MAG: biotin transporter BioY [Synergistaceae bacterium]